MRQNKSDLLVENERLQYENGELKAEVAGLVERMKMIRKLLEVEPSNSKAQKIEKKVEAPLFEELIK
jgi:hypothetical protein